MARYFGFLAALIIVTACQGRPDTNRTDPWSSDIWFSTNDSDHADFFVDELFPLLGTPGQAVSTTEPIVASPTGAAVYRNPIGETVPVRILNADGNEWLPGSEIPSGIPVVVALHQTNTNGGDEPCGEQPSEQLAYGTFFSRAGYLVICPTLSFTGERQPTNAWDTTEFYLQYPSWSAMGKDVQEVSWLLDALAESGFDLDDLSVIGHSQGAVYGLYAAAIDERIDRVVANAGFVDTSTDPMPGRWSRPTWYRGFRAFATGLDYLEVIAAISPRRALLINYSNDVVLVATTPEPERLDAFMERFPSIDWLDADGAHAWPESQLEEALDWVGGEIDSDS